MAFTPQIFSALQNIFCVLSISTMTYIVTAFSFLDLYNTFNEMSCSCSFSPKSRLSELWKTISHDTSLFNIPGWTHFLLPLLPLFLAYKVLSDLASSFLTLISSQPLITLQLQFHLLTRATLVFFLFHENPKLIYIVGSLFFLLILPWAGPSDQIKCSNI